MEKIKLFNYFCKNCNSDNYIKWNPKTYLTMPYCCECGMDTNYEFKGELNVDKPNA